MLGEPASWSLQGWGDLGDIAAVVGLLLILLGALFGSARGQLLIFSSRRLRTVGRAVRRQALGSRPRSPRGAWRRARITGRYMRRRTAGEELTVRDELRWLASLVDGTDHSRPPSGPEPSSRMPLTFLPSFDSSTADPGMAAESRRTRYFSLAHAYDSYAIRAASRWHLRAVALPVVMAEVEIARAAASRLRSYGSTLPRTREALSSGAEPLPYEPPGSAAIPLADPRSHSDLPRRIAISLWHRGGKRGALGYPSLTSSFEPVRFCVAATTTPGSSDPTPTVVLPTPTDTTMSPASAGWGAGPREEGNGAEADGALGGGDSELSYDGVLTRLHFDPKAPTTSDRRFGFREEFDPFSGRQRLHLSLSAVAFSAVQATNYRVFGQGPEHPHVGGSGLLTLNMICLDHDGVAVLVERSGRLRTDPHSFAGTVTGNAEISEREGIRADLDDDGMPDLRAAMAREAVEEIGLVLDPATAHLDPVGLHTITSEFERGTHVLTFVATLAEPSTTWVPSPATSDPIEGAWEIGDHLMTVDLRDVASSSQSERLSFFTWLKSEPSIATHAVGGLLIIMLAAARSSWKAILEEFLEAQTVDDPPLPEQVGVRRWRWADCDSCRWAIGSAQG